MPLLESRVLEATQAVGTIAKETEDKEPPEMIELQDLLHYVCVEEYNTFFREYFKQTTIIAIRKSFELVLRSYIHEKVADRFCREFYPKLRRTVNRYAYSFNTYQKVCISSLYVGTTVHLPGVIYEICSDAMTHWGFLLYGQENINKTKFSSKATVMYLSKKTKKLLYFVVRDSLIRTLITLPIFDKFLCSSQPSHEIATLLLQLFSDSMTVNFLQMSR